MCWEEMFLMSFLLPDLHSTVFNASKRLLILFSLTSKSLPSSGKLLLILLGSSQSYIFLKKTYLMSDCGQVPCKSLLSENVGSSPIGSSPHPPLLSLHQRTTEILDFARWPLGCISSSCVLPPYCSYPVRRVSRFNVCLVFWVYWVEGLCKTTRWNANS